MSLILQASRIKALNDEADAFTDISNQSMSGALKFQGAGVLGYCRAGYGSVAVAQY